MSKTPLFDATGVLAPELRAAHEPPARSLTSDDLELGKAAEHLVQKSGLDLTDGVVKLR